MARRPDLPTTGPSWPTMYYIRSMVGPTPYIHFPGTAREALTFYGEVFGCAVQLHTFAEVNRADGPADAIAHGYLAGGPVALFGADVSGDERPVRSEGMMLALLGTAAPSTLRTWFPGSAKVAGWWTTWRPAVEAQQRTMPGPVA